MNRIQKTFLAKNVLLLTLCAIATLIIIQTISFSLNLDYKAYNGAFQTFNPLRRMFLGEIPGRDFNPYLGLGTTYITAVITFIFGGDFAASKTSIYLVSVLLHFLVLTTLFFLSGFSTKKSFVAAAFIFIIISYDVYRLAPFWELAGPGNSNLGIRSSLPFITSWIVLLLFRLCQNKPQVFYCLGGCLIGIQPLWSNDYGIPSSVALSTIIVIHLVKQESHKIIKAVLLFTSAAIAFFTVASLLTGGNAINWVNDNFGGVATDQFWYFVWYNGKNKIFSLSDLFSNPFLYTYLASLLLILFKILTKNYSIKYLLLFYVGLTVIMAGMLSSVGGTVSVRYYLASILTSFFTIPLAVHLSFPKLGLNTLPIITSKIHLPPIYILPIVYIPVLIINTMPIYFLATTHNSNNQAFEVQELGGWLPNKWKHSVQIARNIKTELKNELPTRRILSTYASGMDVLAGAFNPTGIDYIIHALGTHARNHYTESLNKFKPKYITTLREDYTQWETWVRRTNWWFYREFVRDYQPVEATFYNMVWQRLESTKKSIYPQVVCNIDKVSDNKSIINISTKESTSNTIYYVEASLKYHLEVKPSGIPIIGNRGIVNVTEKKTALTKPIAKIGNRSYGIPPTANNWYVPIEHQLGTSSVLELQAHPTNRAKLVVESCQAELFAPVDEFAFNRRLTAANISDANWHNGIAIASLDNFQAGIAISNLEILPELYPGMDIEFAQAGKRKIIEIKNERVWVTGTRLNPLADGYPHPVTVTLR
jgi:hypothetical protein